MEKNILRHQNFADVAITGFLWGFFKTPIFHNYETNDDSYYITIRRNLRLSLYFFHFYLFFFKLTKFALKYSYFTGTTV